MALEAELIHLFGADIAQQSKALTPQQIFADIELMPFFVRELKQREGKPRQQQKYIKSLSKTRAAALCYWIRET